MEYNRKRTDKDRKPTSRRNLSGRRGKVRATHVLVGSICALCVVTAAIFGTSIYSDPDISVYSVMPDRSLFTKHLVVLQNSVKEQIKTEREELTASTDTTVSVVNGTLTAKEHGVLITDATLNPSGLPLYDGWTMDVATLKQKATAKGLNPDKIKSWDLDFSQFWATENYKDNPGLYGLGDFTNSKPGSHNMISYGNALGAVGAKSEVKATNTGNVRIYDGRVLFAVPGRVFTDPDLLTESVLSAVNSNLGMSRTSPVSQSPNYTGCYRLTYNQNENMVHDWSNCVPNNTGWRAVYFDVLFDDGTVLAGIMTDGKGVHVGYDARGSYCEDTLMSGYGQVRFNKNNPDAVNYQTFLEIYAPGAKNNGLDINLTSKRVLGIRTYNVSGSPSSGTYIKWFTE